MLFNTQPAQSNPMFTFSLLPASTGESPCVASAGAVERSQSEPRRDWSCVQGRVHPVPRRPDLHRKKLQNERKEKETSPSLWALRINISWSLYFFYVMENCKETKTKKCQKSVIKYCEMEFLRPLTSPWWHCLIDIPVTRVAVRNSYEIEWILHKQRLFIQIFIWPKVSTFSWLWSECLFSPQSQGAVEVERRFCVAFEVRRRKSWSRTEMTSSDLQRAQKLTDGFVSLFDAREVCCLLRRLWAWRWRSATLTGRTPPEATRKQERPLQGETRAV